MKFLIAVLLLFFVQTQAQFHRTDSLGHFQVVDHQLIWQKWYDLKDKSVLNTRLKRNRFSEGLDILKFVTSVKTGPQRLQGTNLPEYALHDYEAFLYLDFKEGRYRVTIKQIVFPDFVEKIYYNGMRRTDPRGTLEQYILRQDGLIKRNNTNIRVLDSFDSEFSGIFDAMAADQME